MSRMTSRRFTNNSKQNHEQQSHEQEHQQQTNDQKSISQRSDGYENKENENDNDSLIADMAQGFIQAQAKMTDKAMNFNNLEIALLLQKVTEQLEEIKRSAPTAGQTSEQSSQGSIEQDAKQQNGAGEAAQNNRKEQADGGSAKELQGLLTSLLQGKNNNEQSGSKSSNTQNKDVNKSNGGKKFQNMVAVQTVSQVLAQAQYELANELENSLKKLKQVISKSEKIANDMSNLLDEETMKKS